MDPADLDRMSKQVHDLSGRRLSDIRVDLVKTQSMEMTVNRIFDGTFLEGTERDPSLQAHIILDSDDDDDEQQLPLADTTTTATTATPSLLQRQITILSSPDRTPQRSSPRAHTPSPHVDAQSTSPALSTRQLRDSPSPPPSSALPLPSDDDSLSSSPLRFMSPIAPIRASATPSLTPRHRSPPPITTMRESSPLTTSSPPLDLTVSPPLRELSPLITSPPLNRTTSPPRRALPPLLTSPPAHMYSPGRNTLLFSDNDDNDDGWPSLPQSQSTQPLLVSQGGTSVMDAIDLDSSNNEDDDETASIQRSAPATPTTKRRRITAAAVTDIMQSPRRHTTSMLPMDYLQQWADSSSSSSSDDGGGGGGGGSGDESGMDSATQKSAKARRTKARTDSQLERQAQSQRKKEEQAAKRKAREDAKEAKRRAKEQLKADKEQKKLLEQANRVRSNRNEVLSEMILEVDREFAGSKRGELLREVIVPKEAELREVDTLYYTVAWRRKSKAAWDEEQASFIPYPDNETRIVDEAQVLVFMDAAELCDLVQSPDRDSRIDRMQAAAGPDKQLLLMVEGLEAYYKRKNLLKQRDFEQSVIRNCSSAPVTATATAATASSSSKRPRDPLTAAALTGPTKQAMEEALTYFQLFKNIMLIPTADEEDTVSWIVALTADIGTAPYKRQNNRKQGTSRVGKDPADVWDKMLQEIHLCTPPVAQAIAHAYPTVQALHRAYESTPNRQDREAMLADIEVDRMTVASRSRTVNKPMSKKIHTIFTSDDPSHYVS